MRSKGISFRLDLITKLGSYSLFKSLESICMKLSEK